jgi:multidrug resistance protein MdtO
VRLDRFLSRELAPFPGRFRATLRIVAGCLAALFFTDVLGGGLAHHGHWTIITVFVVSQADAGASLRKSLQRLVGTLAGGLLGILAAIVLADLPALYTPLLGAVVGFGLFASLTTTAPYVFVLGALTFVLVAFLPPGATAVSAIDTGLLRILAITVGVAFGAGAQLVLWPDDPEDKLRAALAARLGTVASTLGALASRLEGRAGAMPPAPTLQPASGNLTAQLDLLTNAEAHHPSLRRRHSEQLMLIVEADRLLTSTVWLADAAPTRGAPLRPEVGREIAVLGRECAELGQAVGAGRAPAPSSPDLDTAAVTPSDFPGLRPTLDDMQLSVRRARAALGFLDPDRPAAPALDQPARRPLLTPGFSARNTKALAFGFKAGLGALICYVLMHALDWEALLTGAVTAVLVSQGSFGASVQKSMLRLAGAVLGGALGMAVVIVAMPNMEDLGSLLVVAALGFGAAAWIMAGSSRISYMGLQTGMAFALCVTDPAGPTTDLTTARDRVLGILIGVLVMMIMNVIFWPVRARLAMRPALARGLRSIGALARVAPEAEAYRARLHTAVRLRSAVYGDLAAMLRLSEESTLEPDAETPAARDERQRMARLGAHAQAVFLSLLALIRHRLSPDFPRLPATVQQGMRALDGDVGDTLDALADLIERGPCGPLPDLAARLATLETDVGAAMPAPPGAAAVHVEVAARDHVAIARDLVHHVLILREAVGAVG